MTKKNGNALNRKIFINSENPRGRRPVTCWIDGKDPKTRIIITYSKNRIWSIMVLAIMCRHKCVVYRHFTQRHHQMKIRNILAISLATSSFSCLAFKSSPNVLPGPTNQLTAVESKIIGHFYAPHSALPGTTITGTCDASPVPGCTCPFCTMLRSQNR